MEWTRELRTPARTRILNCRLEETNVKRRTESPGRRMRIGIGTTGRVTPKVREAARGATPRARARATIRVAIARATIRVATALVPSRGMIVKAESMSGDGLGTLVIRTMTQARTMLGPSTDHHLPQGHMITIASSLPQTGVFGILPTYLRCLIVYVCVPFFRLRGV